MSAPEPLRAETGMQTRFLQLRCAYRRDVAVGRLPPQPGTRDGSRALPVGRLPRDAGRAGAQAARRAARVAKTWRLRCQAGGQWAAG